MRLIDADATKKAIKTECNPYGAPTIDFESGKKVLNIIDNAPTVSLQDIYQEGHYDGHLEGYTKAINEGRPQGEWIVSGYIDTCRGYVAKCSCCKEDTVGGGDFCPNCGADMRERR